VVALWPRASLLDEDSGARDMAGGGRFGGAAELDLATQQGGHDKPVVAHQLGRGRRRGDNVLLERRRWRRAHSDRTAAIRQRGAALTGDGVRRERREKSDGRGERQ
jgi:hypothetical protein